MPVVVFDTNILIGSLLSLTGKPFRCVRLAKTGVIESVTCEEILREFSNVLVRTFDFPLQPASLAADEIRKISRIVKIANTLKVITNHPADDKILECAVTGNAGYVITGDRRHLLKLGTYEGIKIITPGEFLTSLYT